MSFGAGHIQDMNNRIKQNRAQRPSQRPRFKENNRDAIYSYKKEAPITFKKVSPSQLMQFKNEVLSKTMQEKRRDFYLLMAAIGLSAILFFLILKML